MFQRITISFAVPLALLVWSAAAPPSHAAFLYVDTTGINPSVWQVPPSGPKTSFASGFESYGVATNSSGDVFISQYSNGAVVEMSPSGTLLNTYSGFSGPLALTSDASGDIFVANNNGIISEITSSGIVQTFSASYGHNAYGLTTDTAGDVFVSQNSSGTVVELNKSGTKINTFTGFSEPWGVAIGPNGDLYVANFSGSETVTEINPTTDGGTFVQNIGAGELQNPIGLTFDSSGNLYVGEYYKGDVKEVDLETGQISNYATGTGGSGSLAFGSEGPSVAPEPNTLTLLGLALASLAAFRWRRRRIA